MKRRAADRLHRIGTGQRIDANTALEGVVGPNAFDHQHAALHPGEQLGGEDNFAAQVGEADTLAVLNALLGGILGMQEHARAAFALARSWRLSERGI